MYPPAVKAKIAMKIFVISKSRVFSLNFMYFSKYPVKVAAKTIIKQWPTAYEVTSKAAVTAFFDEISNVIANTGAIYANVHGLRAIPKIRPISKAGRWPLNLNFRFDGADHGTLMRFSRWQLTRMKIAAIK